VLREFEVEFKSILAKSWSESMGEGWGTGYVAERGICNVSSLRFVGTWVAAAEVGEKAAAAERLREEGAGDGEWLYESGV